MMEKRFENPFDAAGLSLTASTMGDRIPKTAWAVALPSRMEKGIRYSGAFGRGSD
jgi:hypothetical protein